MTAHCSLSKSGRLVICTTGKTDTFWKSFPIIKGGNKGREMRKTRTNSYWYESYFGTRSWKDYRRNQTKGMKVRESHRYMPDILTQEVIEEVIYFQADLAGLMDM
jgi:hypothetical protein